VVSGPGPPPPVAGIINQRRPVTSRRARKDQGWLALDRPARSPGPTQAGAFSSHQGGCRRRRASTAGQAAWPIAPYHPWSRADCHNSLEGERPTWKAFEAYPGGGCRGMIAGRPLIAGHHRWIEGLGSASSELECLSDAVPRTPRVDRSVCWPDETGVTRSDRRRLKHRSAPAQQACHEGPAPALVSLR